MNDPVVISVEKLGKSYRLSHRNERPPHTSLRDVIADNIRSAFRGKSRESAAISTENFWALDEVSFQVRRGEVIGVIGRNGAGKSTLLKILSRITEPSRGRVQIKGRVASLLEVGTGFHPELTGRENIFLNGAILGMSRAEIRRKFDAIVAFAEVEKFLDTPVKRYSSGMYVRLAFAVAAHLEPEILIIDEVLAVGDAQFQQRCLGKMQDVASREGRTVLFVSHNLAAVQELCPRSVLLAAGRVVHDGDTTSVIQSYLSDAASGNRISLENWSDRSTNGQARILEIELENGTDAGPITVGGNLKIRLHTTFSHPLVNPTFGVIIHDSLGAPLLDLRSLHAGLQPGRIEGPFTVEMTVPQIGLYPGKYFLSPWIADSTCKQDIDFPQKCCSLEIHPSAGEHGDRKLDPHWGRYFVPSQWKHVTPVTPT